MPELSPKQVAIWLAVGALVLAIGGKALRGGNESTTLNASAFAGTGDRSPGTARGGKEVGQEGPRLWVHVAGAVRRPGIYRLAQGSRVADAVRRAGGERRAADLDRVNLAATLSDGQQVLIPRRAAQTAPTIPGADAQSAAAAAAGGGGSAPAPGLAGGGPISLASATTEQLETIDGIGPVTAGKIIEFRDSQGVSSIEELDAIPGIGPVTMETLRQALEP